MKNEHKTLYKYFACFILFSTVVISCKTTNNISQKNHKADPLEGVWELTHFFNLANGDTLITNTSKVQHKMYLNGHVIWNTNPAPDGSEWHGYGTYTFKNDTITEVLSSMSSSMKSDNNTYIIPIELSKNKFKMVNTYHRNDTVFKNIEIYKKID